MASKTERTPILGGGMNMLPPSDKIPEQDAVILENWRVDQVGRLRSRGGSVQEAGPIGSGTFHTLGRVGTWRYGGIGTELSGGLRSGL